MQFGAEHYLREPPDGSAEAAALCAARMFLDSKATLIQLRDGLAREKEQLVAEIQHHRLA